MPDWMLVALTVSGGAVDAICFLALGKVFASFMTGNMVFLGFNFAGATGSSSITIVIALALFGLGAFLGAKLLASGGAEGPVRVRTSRGEVTAPGSSPRIGPALVVVAVLQAVFWAMWLSMDAQPSAAGTNWLMAVIALAMGVQSAAVFATGVRAVFTTAATATWVVFFVDLANPASAQHGERRRLIAVVIGIFAGAFIGALLLFHARGWAPLMPLVITAACAAIWSRGRHLTATTARTEATAH